LLILSRVGPNPRRLRYFFFLSDQGKKCVVSDPCNISEWNSSLPNIKNEKPYKKTFNIISRVVDPDPDCIRIQ
jgi:hypothetical protein